MNDHLQLQAGGEHRVFETPWQDFYFDDIEHTDGKSGKYSWIKSHSGTGAIMVIPVTPTGRILLIKIYRHPTKQYLWEFPAGGIEGGESPEAAGFRELVEETGVRADKVELLGSLIPIGPLVGERYQSVVATIPEIELADVEVQREEGIVEAMLVTPEELVEMVSQQRILDGVTLANLARYWALQGNFGKAS